LRVVDSHQHIGTSMFSGVETTAEGLLAAMDAHGVDLAFAMPQPTREDVRPIHDRIAEAAGRSSGRIRGMASIDPWISDADYRAEARRCVLELGFVALKLHPLGHNLPPTHGEAAKVFREADELGVPVIVHTGLGTPWSLPSLCIPPARRHPKLPIVLAHAGWGVYSAEAIVAAEVCENVYLEPSWCPTYMARQMVDRFGADRVLFGSDHLSNLPVELVKYRSIGLDETQLGAVLGGTAARIFPID
jgi:predicted TIM-barrel fold metal-dependent hydrolase